jgi:hypothetical protein
MNALLLLGILAQAPAPAAPPPATRADVHVTIGWQNLYKPQPQDHYNEWMNSILHAGAGGSWYWNDHLRTQVDFGMGTRGSQYRYREVLVGTTQTVELSRVRTRKQAVAVGQQYQFFRNQWFHPHVGAGIDLAREETTEEFQPVFAYDSATRTSRQIAGPRTEGPNHALVARPFLETGFKAYMTRRAFFLTDARVTFRHHVDEVLFRFGFGVDF